MENTFDLKKFLVENKLTNNSRLVEEASKDQVEKQIFDFINTPEVGALIDKAVAKLDPETKQQIASKLQALAEGSSDDFMQFKQFAEKGLQTMLQEREANDEEGDLQKENYANNQLSPGPLSAAIGKVMTNLGVANIMSMGFLPAIVGVALDHFAGTDLMMSAASLVGGSGSGAAVLSVVAGLVGGGLLWRIGKALQGEEVTGDTPLFQ